MSYLSPEIEAWFKDKNTKSLVRSVVSCGIFQDYNNEVPKANQQQNLDKEGR